MMSCVESLPRAGRLQYTGLVGYLDGSLKAPTDPKDNPDWLAYSSHIIGTLGHLVNDSLAQELLPDMLAANAWFFSSNAQAKVVSLPS